MDNIIFIDNSEKLLNTLRLRARSALSGAGSLAVGYAKTYAPISSGEYGGSGKLRDSLRFEPVDGACYVGTDIKAANGAPYAVFVEFGTGIFAADGNGRKSPWVWFDDDGGAHYTRGIRPSHFLKNAMQYHRNEYLRVIKDSLSARFY